MKLGKVTVVPMCTHQNWMKNKKVLITDRLIEMSSVKVPLRSY